ncbi:MAG: UDP-N-acetylglucosamine pyrophosphorylase [Candidatus Kapabacteria bacterium]|nr:UDP-N-acetylglucosamine pyrophosphorylase [Candidatus Kapabacteria bacterium]
MGDPERAKVLTPLFDKPLLGYVLDQAAALAPSRIVVIIGHQRDAVRAFVGEYSPTSTCAEQLEQLGTGHAVMQTHQALEGFEGDVLILSGDVPLVRTSTLEHLVQQHRDSAATATVLSARVPDATGYGRILRDGQGALQSIIEHKDASDEQRAIDEINSGIYVVNAHALFEALSQVNNSNAQQEYYLTDIIGIFGAQGKNITAWCGPSWEELHGINTPADLQRAADIMSSGTLAS